ncbi:MAG: 50S ribosomal protein L31e, partial [Candidatus Bathyarchaeota archaeon]|nr:50S ribosomal protein L31e [Candidatus Bathyarchaeota archaeon]
MANEEVKSEQEPPEEVKEVETEETAAEAKEPVQAEEIEEEIEIVEEKFYTVNLRDLWAAPKDKRAPKAVRTLREFVKRHMKVDNVKVSNEINQEIWARSIQKPPRKLKIRAV